MDIAIDNSNIVLILIQAKRSHDNYIMLCLPLLALSAELVHPHTRKTCLELEPLLQLLGTLRTHRQHIIVSFLAR